MWGVSAVKQIQQRTCSVGYFTDFGDYKRSLFWQEKVEWRTLKVSHDQIIPRCSLCDLQSHNKFVQRGNIWWEMLQNSGEVVVLFLTVFKIKEISKFSQSNSGADQQEGR